MSKWADEIDSIPSDRSQTDEGVAATEVIAGNGADDANNNNNNVWANVKTVVETITDNENKRYEVIKKVRTYHVDRAATEVDVRAKWKRFGKESNEPSKDLISRDPPIVLELGDVDPFERAARDELMRLMNDVERARIEVNDARLARFGKLKEEQEKAALAEASTSDQPRERTWAAARNERGGGGHDEDTERRLRVTNISDDITKDELRNIFDTDSYHIERLFLPEDKITGNYRGFAFITFETAEQANRCLEKTKGIARFKNTVMKIVRALPEGNQRRH